ncbi:hypothetical protein ACWEIJ_43350 [Lentzea sp. NPDC004789]
MSKIKTSSAAALAFAAMLTGFAVPASATASGSVCSSWYDRHTFGVTCDGAARWQASGRCANGMWLEGPWVSSGGSYIYCSTYNSQYVEGSGRARVETYS